MGRRLAVAGLVLLFVGAACGDGDDAGSAVASSTTVTEAADRTTTPTAEDANQGTTETEPAASSSTTMAESTTTSGSNPGPPSDPSALRQFLGADRIVVRTATGVVASSDDGEIDLVDGFPGVYAEHLLDDGMIVDYVGQPVCPDLELVGDFLIIDEVISEGGTPIVFLEDRRMMAGDAGTGSGADTTSVPRWRHDCSTGEVTEIPATTTVRWDAETSIVTTTSPRGLDLVAEWGAGDTPVLLSNGSGTLLIDTDTLAFDYVLAPDERTVYATTYAGTGAASPPDGVIAIDVETGAERWRRDVGGFVHLLGDRLVIEEVDSQISDFGLFAGRDVIIVDPATGAELERIAFADRIVGVF